MILWLSLSKNRRFNKDFTVPKVRLQSIKAPSKYFICRIIPWYKTMKEFSLTHLWQHQFCTHKIIYCIFMFLIFFWSNLGTCTWEAYAPPLTYISNLNVIFLLCLTLFCFSIINFFPYSIFWFWFPFPLLCPDPPHLPSKPEQPPFCFSLHSKQASKG